VPLNGKQKRSLRAKGHHLQVVVQVGSSGVTPGVVGALTQALADHELVKVKVALDREEREAALAQLLEGTGAELAQVLGKTALLFKKRLKKSRFEGLAALGAAEPEDALQVTRTATPPRSPGPSTAAKPRARPPRPPR
jgi:RNA-binding protein